MNYKKIIKKGDIQYQLIISPYLDSFNNKPMRYRVHAYCRSANKKKWGQIPDTLNEYAFRSLSLEDREKHRLENILRFISDEEIYEAKLECWNLLKPNKNHEKEN